MACTADIVLNGVIRFRHVYKTVWIIVFRETQYLQTSHAIAIVKNFVVVGRAAREMVQTF